MPHIKKSNILLEHDRGSQSSSSFLQSVAGNENSAYEDTRTNDPALVELSSLTSNDRNAMTNSDCVPVAVRLADCSTYGNHSKYDAYRTNRG